MSEERDEERKVLDRRVLGSTLFVADAANVFLQLGWPAVGYGVVESTVTSGQVMRHPFKRARTTFTHLGLALIGTQEQIDAYRLEVNRAHRTVRSGPQSPVSYNAFDRELQLWVASCLFYGLWDVTTRTSGPIPADEEEVLLRAAARFGTNLQLHPDQWHRSMADFWTYWDEGTRRIDIDATIRAYFLDLLHLRMLPPPLRAILGPLHAWLNTGFSPPIVRDQLGLRWTDTDQARHDRVMRVMGRTGRLLPKPLRWFPLNLAVWATFGKRRLGRTMV